MYSDNNNNKKKKEEEEKFGTCDVINTELRSCVKVEVAVLDPSLVVRTVSVDVKQHYKTELWSCVKVEVDLRSCVKVEVDHLDSTSLIVFMISVDVKQHLNRKKRFA